MEYKLIFAREKDINLIITYKLDSILKFANKLSKQEIDKIKTYVNDTIKNQINDYHLFEINNEIKGCYYVNKKDNGVLLDEIYIDEQYRNRGIGTSIIKQLLLNNDVIYLWVYRLNIDAINLYKNLGFKIINTTENRYYMKYSK